MEQQTVRGKTLKRVASLLNKSHLSTEKQIIVLVTLNVSLQLYQSFSSEFRILLDVLFGS